MENNDYPGWEEIKSSPVLFKDLDEIIKENSVKIITQADARANNQIICAIAQLEVGMIEKLQEIVAPLAKTIEQQLLLLVEKQAVEIKDLRARVEALEKKNNSSSQ